MLEAQQVPGVQSQLELPSKIQNKKKKKVWGEGSFHLDLRSPSWSLAIFFFGHHGLCPLRFFKPSDVCVFKWMG